MTLDELRNYDFKQLPHRSTQHQNGFLLLMVVIIVSIGFYFIVYPMFGTLERSQRKEDELKKSFVDKSQKVANLNALVAQMQQIEVRANELLHRLPSKKEMDSLLSEINQAGLGRGLQFDLFKPNVEIQNIELSELPIQIEVSGSYDALANFISDTARMTRIVVLKDLSIEPIEVDKNQNKSLNALASMTDNKLKLKAFASTYRALDPEERSAALKAKRQAEIDARKKAGKGAPKK